MLGHFTLPFSGASALPNFGKEPGRVHGWRIVLLLYPGPPVNCYIAFSMLVQLPCLCSGRGDR